MRLALTTSGETLEAPLDPRFGRAPRFLVFDTDTTAFEIVDNRAGLEAAQGAGIQAAEKLARLGAGRSRRERRSIAPSATTALPPRASWRELPVASADRRWTSAPPAPSLPRWHGR
jgi:hypothetical protein